MEALRHQRILILGLGQSGLALARFCLHFGADITVLDTRSEPPGLSELQQINPQALVVTSLDEQAWFGFDRIITSPGLSPHTEPLQRALGVAQQRGITVDSEIELFAQALNSLAQTQQYAPKLIGITGTNGKTTTTALAKLLVEKAGRSVVMAGNVSPAALDALLQALTEQRLPDVWVLELSSFQLFATRSLQCHAAAVLNVTQDHLDWHQTMPAYADAKARIFGENTIRVLNRDDALCVNMAKNAQEHAVWFGVDEPSHAGDYGLSREGGLVWLSYAEPLPLEGGRRRKDEVIPFLVKNFMPADALHIRGLHNASNALAALALCRAIDLPVAKLLHGLREYRGEPHRVEWVANFSDVDYFDDSKGTNVGATVAALNGLARRVVLIAGGDGKGQDFAPLVSPVKQFARAVVVLGKDADLIATTLNGHGVLVERAASLESATEIASRLAQAGDAVLLSPACSSLDMFKNYEHRAQVFTGTVHELATQAGQLC